MSYDLHLFFATPDRDLLEQAEEAIENEEQREGRGARRRDPDLIRKRIAIARALADVNPRLAADPPLEDLEARLSVADGKGAVPQATELAERNGTTGLQITLFNDSGAINLPYWHQAAAAEAAFVEIEAYLHALQDQFGMYAYDQQLGKVFEPGKDRHDALRLYEPHVFSYVRLSKIPDQARRLTLHCSRHQPAPREP